ncbi:MAG: LysR family transcriptional regulator, partial [Phyllobacteriaceae bacterium]|nr:LysR family transcriptional regulator [Phyllobacteriaceae bacterium]
MYDWDDLRVFLALVRAGSLSAAARALGVEHTTVARRIEGLERDLGVTLF